MDIKSLHLPGGLLPTEGFMGAYLSDLNKRSLSRKKVLTGFIAHQVVEYGILSFAEAKVKAARF